MAKAQPYDVLTTLSEGVELRHYPRHTLISVEVEGDFESAGNRAFRPLVSYISGSNSRGDRLAMTSPVVQAPHQSSHTMSFVLPEGISAQEAPLPADANVTVHEVAPREVAALRFSGSWKQRRAEDKGRCYCGCWPSETFPRWEKCFMDGLTRPRCRVSCAITKC